MKRIWMVLTAICLFVGAAACASESGTTTEEADTGTATGTTTEEADTGTATATPPTTPAYDAGAAEINIEGNSFGAPPTVTPGAVITVANGDTAEHSVTSDTAGLFDVHIDGNSEGSFVAPTEPGEYPFHCTYHPSMKGTLIVT